MSTPSAPRKSRSTTVSPLSRPTRSLRTPPTPSRFPTDAIFTSALALHFDEMPSEDRKRVQERARTLYGKYERERVKVPAGTAVPLALVELAAESCSLSLPSTLRKTLPKFAGAGAGYAKTVQVLRLALGVDEYTAATSAPASLPPVRRQLSQRTPNPLAGEPSLRSLTPPLPPLSTTPPALDAPSLLLTHILTAEGFPPPITTLALNLLNSLHPDRKVRPETPTAVALACASAGHIYVNEPRIARLSRVPVALVIAESALLKREFKQVLEQVARVANEFTEGAGAGADGDTEEQGQEAPAGGGDVAGAPDKEPKSGGMQEDDAPLEPPTPLFTPTTASRKRKSGLAPSTPGSTSASVVSTSTPPTTKRPRQSLSVPADVPSPSPSPAAALRGTRTSRGMGAGSGQGSAKGANGGKGKKADQDLGGGGRVWTTGMCSIMPHTSRYNIWSSTARLERWYAWRDGVVRRLEAADHADV